MTQVVSPFEDLPTLHNRLTHSEKVAQVARSIAEDLLCKTENHGTILKLGGLDRNVCEAAALAHDLGHPPFGHVGERTLDEIARRPVATGGLGLDDGFEGNAQSFRIVTQGKVRSTKYEGYDLTSATLAAIAKYPWTRVARDANEERHREKLKSDAEYRRHWRKFNAYSCSEDLLTAARDFTNGRIGAETQTLEASIMDVADDISYAVHDFEDFYLAGIVDTARIVQDLVTFETALRSAHPDTEVSPQNPFAEAAKRLKIDYEDYFDKSSLIEGVTRTKNWISENFGDVKVRRYRAASAHAGGSEMIERLIRGVTLNETPLWEGGPHVGLKVDEWHTAQVLKVIAKQYVIERPDIALIQRGQQRVLEELVAALRDWMDDPDDRSRIPEGLHAEHEIAVGLESGAISDGYKADSSAPRGDPNRSVIDYICTLTDHQCISLHRKLTGNQIHTINASSI